MLKYIAAVSIVVAAVLLSPNSSLPEQILAAKYEQIKFF